MKPTQQKIETITKLQAFGFCLGRLNIAPYNCHGESKSSLPKTLDCSPEFYEMREKIKSAQNKLIFLAEMEK